MSWHRWTMIAWALVLLAGCVEDAWAQHAGANPDPRVRPRTPGPGVLGVIGRDAGLPDWRSDVGVPLGGLMGDSIDDGFGAGGLGTAGGAYVVPDAGTLVGGAIGQMATGRGRFEAIAVEGRLPVREVQAALSRVAGRANHCLVAARQTGWTDVPVRFEFGAPPTAPIGRFDTDNAVVRRCLTESLARAVVSPSTPVTRVTARFRLGFPPDAGR